MWDSQKGVWHSPAVGCGSKNMALVVMSGEIHSSRKLFMSYW